MDLKRVKTFCCYALRRFIRTIAAAPETSSRAVIIMIGAWSPVSGVVSLEEESGVLAELSGISELPGSTIGSRSVWTAITEPAAVIPDFARVLPANWA